MNVGQLIDLVYLASGLTLFMLAGVIFRENPRGRLNIIAAMMLFFAGIGPLGVSIYGSFLEGVQLYKPPAPWAYKDCEKEKRAVANLAAGEELEGGEIETDPNTEGAGSEANPAKEVHGPAEKAEHEAKV